MDKMKIYSFPTFNVTKVLMTAEELNLDYEFELIDNTKGEHKSAEHLARHPLGKVPALEYDGEFYIESNSICRFLSELNGNKLYSSDPKKKAEINSWLDIMALHTGRWMGVLFFEEVIKPKLLNGEPNQAQVEEANGYLNEQLPVMEKVLSERAFLSGDSLTIADIIAFSYCNTSDNTSLNFGEFPYLAGWYKGIKERPSYKKTMKQVPGGRMVPFAT